MANSCTNSVYFSGQGSVLLAERNPQGEALGFRPVGNVSALTIGIETETFEHKESCSGVRAIDLELTQEVNATVAMTMESLSKENLALALYGGSADVAAASVADEAVTGYHDLWSGLSKVNVSNVVVTNDTGATTYTEDTDYELNMEAGSIKILSTGAITDGQALLVDFDHTAQSQIDALLSSSAPVRWLRFEGLNTADTNKPVVVDVFRFSTQPLAELALINEELTNMELEGKALADNLRSSGSLFFQVRYIE